MRQKGLTRRTFLKGAGGALAAWFLASRARAAVSKGNVPSVLVDLSRCIGCGACERACQRANHLSAPETELGTRHELTYNRWTVVSPEGQGQGMRFVKRQCMHCLEPACVSVCPVASLYQTDQGPVVYRAGRCIGCRYCMVACPFEVPRFEWGSGLTPVIGKCQLCAQERLFRGLAPACADACPTGALKFGRRADLLHEAHARIHARPDKYVDHVYGEEEIGGTSWLYISDVPFDTLGFKALPRRPLPSLTWDVVSRLPAVVTILASLLAPVALSLSRKEKTTASPERRAAG